MTAMSFRLPENKARSEDYFAVRAARASTEKFGVALRLVPSEEPVEGDELSDRAAFLAVLDKAPDVPLMEGDELP